MNHRSLEPQEDLHVIMRKSQHPSHPPSMGTSQCRFELAGNCMEHWAPRDEKVDGSPSARFQVLLSKIIKLTNHAAACTCGPLAQVCIGSRG